LWQNILVTNPGKTITDKINLSSNWFVQVLHLFCCKLFYIIAKLMWRIKVTGRENLPRGKPIILCPNHASYLDTPLILASIPSWLCRTIFFLGFDYFSKIPIVRNLIKMGRVIPLDPATNLIDAMRVCSYILRYHKTICIFPEGGRSPDGTIQSFKKGVGILAQELNLQLVPIYIAGSFQALPRNKFWPKFNQISLTFGKPCSPDYLKSLGTKLGAKGDYEVIAKGLEQEVNNLKN
jgi:long-chain acyl-CoA synthetase